MQLIFPAHLTWLLLLHYLVKLTIFRSRVIPVQWHKFKSVCNEYDKQEVIKLIIHFTIYLKCSFSASTTTCSSTRKDNGKMVGPISNMLVESVPDISQCLLSASLCRYQWSLADIVFPSCSSGFVIDVLQVRTSLRGSPDERQDCHGVTILAHWKYGIFPLHPKTNKVWRHPILQLVMVIAIYKVE